MSAPHTQSPARSGSSVTRGRPDRVPLTADIPPRPGQGGFLVKARDLWRDLEDSIEGDILGAAALAVILIGLPLMLRGLS